MEYQAKERRKLEVLLEPFIEESAYVRWTLDAGILAHLTNRVLPETSFWDELQQKEYRSVSKFYRKENKFLKLENSKEALYKAQGMSTGKKNDLGEATENTKGKEKRKGNEKRAKSPNI